MNKILQVIRVTWLKRIANKRARQKQMIQFVMMWEGKPRIVDYDDFARYYHPGYLCLKSTLERIKRESIYYTRWHDKK